MTGPEPPQPSSDLRHLCKVDHCIRSITDNGFRTLAVLELHTQSWHAAYFCEVHECINARPQYGFKFLDDRDLHMIVIHGRRSRRHMHVISTSYSGQKKLSRSSTRRHICDFAECDSDFVGMTGVRHHKRDCHNKVYCFVQTCSRAKSNSGFRSVAASALHMHDCH